jgi:hypothetical protein
MSALSTALPTALSTAFSKALLTALLTALLPGGGLGEAVERGVEVELVAEELHAEQAADAKRAVSEPPESHQRAVREPSESLTDNCMPSGLPTT